jgi:uncharacterized membrane protein
MENLHPIFVHFPIALVFLALFFALVAIILPHKREVFKEMLMWTLLLGALAAITTAGSGYFAARQIPHNEAIHKIMAVHQTYGLIIGSGFLVLTLWMLIRRIRMNLAELVFMTLFLAALTGLVGYSASLGGKMVYEHGAGVVPMQEMMEQQGHHIHNEDMPLQHDTTSHYKDSISDSTAIPVSHTHEQQEHKH